MLFSISFRLVGFVQGLLWAYAPSNIIIRYIRSPRGLKWALPVSVVLAPAYYFAAGGIAYLHLETGHMWLVIPALLSWISAAKFACAIILSPLWILANWWRHRSLDSTDTAEPQWVLSDRAG